MFQRFFDFFHHGMQRSSQTSAMASSSLKIESLESRIALTIAPGTVDTYGTELRIEGTSSGDHILIAEIDDNYFVSVDFLNQPMLFAKDTISAIAIDAGAGDDTVVATSLTSHVTILGGDGNDQLFGGSWGDTIFGDAGNDLIYGNGGGDSIYGGAGSDRILGGSGNDQVRGGDGVDFLVGMEGSDYLEGNAGDDQLNGSAGNDVVRGGAGNDQLLGGAGDDSIQGGNGDDWLFGEADSDTMYGDDGDDRLFGAQGDDQMYGGAGSDRMIGSFGNDFLSGGSGADLLYGDDGNDNMQGGPETDDLYGGAGLDTLMGNSGDDRLYGGDGADVLSGHGGADQLFGNNGQDVLIGGTGLDDLAAGSEADYLIGGTTSHQSQFSQLATTRSALLQDSDYDAKIASILSGYTVADASDADRMLGEAGRDIFYSLNSESVVDRGALEANVGADPRAVDDAYTFVAGESASVSAAEGVLANDLRVDRTASVVTLPTSGTLSLQPDGSFQYRNTLAGTYTFVYEVTSSADALSSSQATVVLTVEGFQTEDDAYDGVIGSTLSVSADDGVLANDELRGVTGVSAVVVTQPQHGALTFQPDGSFEYEMGTYGRDTFTYQVTNPLSGESVSATVKLAVPNLPELPDGAELTTTESGLQYYDLVVGSGDFPDDDSVVVVDYTGYLPNGDTFDSGENSSFSVSGVIDGFSEGVKGMQPGGRRRMIIPPDLGYGESGRPTAGIGGTDIITFDVTLDSIS